MAFHLSFLFLFALAFIQSPENRERKNAYFRFIKSFALISVIASVALAIMSLTMMTTYCIFCIALYLLSILNVAVLAREKQISFIPSSDDFKRIFKSGENGLIYVLVSIIAVPVIAFLSHDMSTRSFKQQTAYMITDVIAEWERSSEESFTNPLLKLGEDNSKFTIVEFADFQCIHCKNAAHGLHSFATSRPDIQFLFYSFPLDSSCNPAMSGAGNGKSCALAKAVYCAEKQNKGWAAHQWIFDRFGKSENSEFEKMSKDIGIEYQAFVECVQSSEASDAIAANAKLGDQVKIGGTPAVFVNGKRLVNGHILAILEELYNKVVK